MCSELRHDNLRQPVVHIIHGDRRTSVRIRRRVTVNLLEVHPWTILDPHLDSLRHRRYQALHFIYKNFVDVFVVRMKVIKVLPGYWTEHIECLACG